VKPILQQVARKILLNACKKNSDIVDLKTAYEMSTFIKKEATYEQLLNLAFNSNRETKYLPVEVLEFASWFNIMWTLDKMGSGRHPIGVMKENTKLKSTKKTPLSEAGFIASIKFQQVRESISDKTFSSYNIYTEGIREWIKDPTNKTKLKKHASVLGFISENVKIQAATTYLYEFMIKTNARLNEGSGERKLNQFKNKANSYIYGLLKESALKCKSKKCVLKYKRIAKAYK